MYIKILNNSNKKGGDNTLSTYLKYLDKEGPNEYYNDINNDIESSEVEELISNDYFTIIVSPSQPELKHINENLNENLQKYTNDLMEQYVYDLNDSVKKHFAFNPTENFYIINDYNNKNNIPDFIDKFGGKNNHKIYIGKDYNINNFAQLNAKIDELLINGIDKKDIQINFVNEIYTGDKSNNYGIVNLDTNQFEKTYNDIKINHLYKNVAPNIVINKKNFILNKNYNYNNVTINDLKYVAKIENKRHFNYNDKWVKYNKSLISLQNKIKNEKNKYTEKEIQKFIETNDIIYNSGFAHQNENGKIYFDFNINEQEFIKNNVEKKGLNNHIHIIIDKKGTNGQNVGPFQYFNKKNFAVNSETMFDEKFSFKTNICRIYSI